MKVLLSKGVTHPVGRQVDVSWEGFKDLVYENSVALANESDATKRAAPWFSPVEYRGGQRRRENIIGRPWAIVADLDEVKDPEGVKKALSRYEYCAWTTWNSTPERPRWRVVLPVEGGVEVDQFASLAERVLAKVAKVAKVDPRSRTPEQLWFLPVHKRSMQRAHKVWTNSGKWIHGANGFIHVDFTGIVNVHSPESIGRGDRNNALVRRLNQNDALLCETRDELQDIAMDWNARLKEPMDRREVLGVVRKTWNWMQRGPGVAKRAEAWRIAKTEIEIGTLGVGLLDPSNTGAQIPKSLVGDFLYPGAMMLSAKMKEGKSYLAMQLAISAAEGVPFLKSDRHDGFPVHQKAKAVILALEDTPGGINKRFHGNIASGHLARPGGTFGDNIRTVYLEDLEKARASVPSKVDGLAIFEKAVQDWYNMGYRVICIDPLAALAGALGIVDYPGCHRGMNIHTRDFQTMRYFTALAQRFDNLCFVISMHHGKNKSGHDDKDPGDMIAGSSGFGAGVVTTMSLLPIPPTLAAKDEDAEGETSKRRELYIHGRYTREARVLIEQDKKTGLWGAIGKVSDELVTSAREEYFKVLIDLGADDSPVTAEEVRKQLEGRVSVRAIHQVLKRAMARGTICYERRLFSKRGPGGGYRLRRVGARGGWLVHDGTEENGSE